MELPFGRTKALESQVDSFLDMVDKGILAMKEAIRCYLVGDKEEFKRRLKSVRKYESQADDLVRAIETALYTYSLLPESRGDVLELLERTDSIIDQAKGVLGKFLVEMPEIPEEFRTGFLEVTERCVLAVDHVIRAERSYFRDPHQVKHDTNKVDFYESEADRSALNLKKAIFRSDLDLARKSHLRYFAENIESISDLAQGVAGLVDIATIKRSV